MTASILSYAGYSLGTLIVGLLLLKLRSRIQLSLAKHGSFAGHPRLAKILARVVPFYEYDDSAAFAVDRAPLQVEEQRRAGFRRLSELYAARYAATYGLTRDVHNWISDLQFTTNYRVPFQFRTLVRRHLKIGSFLQSSSGVTVTDLDGNTFYDLAGSYGVNLFGYDFYKECIDRAVERARDLGPVLGSYHPLVAYNVQRLREISGLDEVSFHMSGTEAVMQAVRLARYHTRRTHVVRFCGAYHGWWGDVQPGVGNPLPSRETHTLQDMSERSLRVLRTRRDIACVLVNPLQAMHPNKAAPSDSTLLDSSRSGKLDRHRYQQWLRALREVCRSRGIPLIFDEVFVGFRLGLGGAQEYFNVRADLVVYGKTLGGGLPVGVLCGRRDLMMRYRKDHPADVCFARGTFNSHPYVMASMHEFLRRLGDERIKTLYRCLEDTWTRRAERMNAALAEAAVPVRVENMSSIWTVCYTQPSCYNWMLQYYLRAEGLSLSWIGTGRLIFSLDYSDADFEAVVGRFVAAARAMQADGWWWFPPNQTNAHIRRRLLREMLVERL